MKQNENKSNNVIDIRNESINTINSHNIQTNAPLIGVTICITLAILLILKGIKDIYKIVRIRRINRKYMSSRNKYYININ